MKLDNVDTTGMHYNEIQAAERIADAIGMSVGCHFKPEVYEYLISLLSMRIWPQPEE